MVVRPIASGTRRYNKRKVSITLDEDTFEAIYKLAKKAKINLTEQVRDLIEWGLEANVSK